MDTSEQPPGPANLLQDALQHPNSAPLQQVPDSLHRTRPSLASTSTGSTRSSTPDVAVGHRATTTITTVQEDGREGVTQTFTHTGVDTVAAAYSSATGQITLRPIPVKGLDASKVKTRRSNRTHFTPRISHFDRHNTTSQQDPFRGFWVLFWMMVFLGALRTLTRHWMETGSPFGVQFATLISEDGWALALSDGVMVLATFACVVFAKLIVNGWIRYYWTGLVLQHVGQATFLGVAVRWTFHRNWPWVQSGFMTLHALSMLMKVHSYCATVGEMAERDLQLNKDVKKLDALLEQHGGRRKVEAQARAAWERACAETPSLDAPSSPPSVLLHPASTTSALDTESSSATSNDELSRVRQRNVARRKSSDRRSPSRSNSDGAVEPHPQPSKADAPHEGPETLTWHPDAKVSELAIAIADANEALTSSGEKKVRFPANVTWWNFVDYLLCPTLVYELEYPRAKTIRLAYIAEKTAATFGTFSLLVLIVEHFILPVHPTSTVSSTASTDSFLHGALSFASSVLDLALPFCVCYLLIFFIIFECILNVFAEVTMFSDRAFYSDWWNSISFDEFSRKWNRPVHTFLLRHVYATTISTYRLSKFSAAFVTFLLSAAVHELVMAVVTKKIRLYLFVLQMAQLPLIMLGRARIFKEYPSLGNLFFWFGLLSGFPILAVAYLRY